VARDADNNKLHNEKTPRVFTPQNVFGSVISGDAEQKMSLEI
jgi:hypothetical protein